MSARTLFVAGAHTEIGKTHVAGALLRAARARGLSVDVLKPVVSGFDPADWSGSDPGRLLAAAGERLTAEALERISPWRFAAPLAPPVAARREARALPFADVAAFVTARLAAASADLVVVEGVGGLMSPIADGATTLDLLRSAGGANLLVTGAYLGAMSHGLTALEVLRRDAIAPLAVVASESGAPDDPDFEETFALLAEHVGETPLVAARRDADDWADALLGAVMTADV